MHVAPPLPSPTRTPSYQYIEGQVLLALVVGVLVLLVKVSDDHTLCVGEGGVRGARGEGTFVPRDGE